MLRRTTASSFLKSLRHSLQNPVRPTRLRGRRPLRYAEPLELRIVLENQPPENMVPAAQTVQVNQPLAFTEFHENQISTSDPDAGLNKIKVTLTAEHGVITLNYPDPNGGLTYSIGDGTSDVTMTFTGKIPDINTALSWLVFQPDPDYIGTEASVTITTDDQGYFGPGGPKQDTDTISIDVTAVPAFEDSPTWTTFPGALDTTFGTDGMQTLSVSAGIDFIRQMKLLPDGKIVAVGSVNNHFGIMRFNTDLTLDTTFGTDGVTESNFGDGQIAWEIIDHPEGGYLVSGTSRIARYTIDGQLDTSFGTDGVVSNGHLNIGNSMDITDDGRVLVSGYDGSSRYRLSRYTLDGALEANWDIDPGDSWNNTERNRGVFSREDGDIILLGNVRDNGGFKRSVRVNFQGSVEYRGTLPDLGSNHYAENALSLPDGKYLLVGQVNGNAYIGRWNADGSPDSTFGTNGAVQIPVLNGADIAFRPALQPDGKIVIVGQAHNGSNWDFALIRMTYDGVLDGTLTADGTPKIGIDIDSIGADDYGYAMLVMPNGKYVLAGRSGNNIALVRLYGDNDVFEEGAADPTLDPINNRSVDEDCEPFSVSITGITAGYTEEQPLRVTATSSNTGVLLNPVVTYTSPERTGSLLFSPVAAASGVTTITVTVEDAGDDGDFGTAADNRSFQQTFEITVREINDLPTLDAIENLVLAKNSGETTVLLQGISAGTAETQQLRVTAVSSNEAVIPHPVVTYKSPQDSGSLAMTPVADAAGTVTITVTVEDAGLDDDLSTTDDNAVVTRSFLVTVTKSNEDPTLDAIEDVTIDEDAAEQTISLSGITAGDGDDQPLRITATSSNPALIATPAVQYTSPQDTGILKFTPAAETSGTATITVTVEDAGLDGDLGTAADNATVTRTFLVTVNAVNDAPTLDAIDDLTILEDSAEQTIALTGITAGGGESQPLRVTVTSSNTNLIPTPTVSYTSPDAAGTLKLQPTPIRSGSATITVLVEDGGTDGDLGTAGDNSSCVRTFIVNVTPIRPVITSPGISTSSQRPRLEWTAVPEAVSYEIWIGNSSTGQNPYVRGSSDETFFDVPGDLGVGKMDLWVRAKKSNGTFLPWTRMHRFNVVTPPHADDAPKRQETARPEFTWPAVPGAIAYDLWVNNFSTGENQVYRSSLTEPNWTPPEDLPMSRYRMWVRAEGPEGFLGDWSIRTDFYIVPAPETLSPILPTFELTPTFDFSDITGATGYGVFLKYLVDGSITANVANLATSEWTPEYDLAPGLYAWWAIAESSVAGFRSAWTPRQEFYVGGLTTITSPDSTAASTTPLIQWLAVTGADHYVLQVNGDTEGAKLIYRDDLTDNFFQVVNPLVSGRTYRVWVKAVSTTGQHGPWTGTYTFTVATTEVDQLQDLLPSEQLVAPDLNLLDLPRRTDTADAVTSDKTSIAVTNPDGTPVVVTAPNLLPESSSLSETEWEQHLQRLFEHSLPGDWYEQIAETLDICRRHGCTGMDTAAGLWHAGTDSLCFTGKLPPKQNIAQHRLLNNNHRIHFSANHVPK